MKKDPRWFDSLSGEFYMELFLLCKLQEEFGGTVIPEFDLPKEFWDKYGSYSHGEWRGPTTNYQLEEGFLVIGEGPYLLEGVVLPGLPVWVVPAA